VIKIRKNVAVCIHMIYLQRKLTKSPDGIITNKQSFFNTKKICNFLFIPMKEKLIFKYVSILNIDSMHVLDNIEAMEIFETFKRS